MIDRPKDFQYQVPRRFGLRTVLVVMAVFAALLSVVQWTDAKPIDLIVCAGFVALVAGSQVVLDRSPRLASILAGACFLTILKFSAFVVDDGLATMINDGPFIRLFAERRLIFVPVFGALLGYLAGTLLAGLYLVIDTLQRAVVWQTKQERIPTEAS